MKARYNRISSLSQNLDRQLAKQNPDEVLYNDIVSGVVPFEKREQGKKLIQDVIDGKINFISFSSIDRCGRNLSDILGTLELFFKHNVVVRVDNLGLESMVNGKKNPTFDLIISVLLCVYSAERDALLERQREGIMLAKLKGVYKGRERGSVEPVEVFLGRNKKAVKLLNEKKSGSNKLSLRQIAKICDVSLGTIQKVNALV